ncbi:acyl-CoA thioesterase [Algihabitans albus]|uniref:acyl-CoA thioesterase n=1 Tax=Algihabitans albus TaxID=2164067 RepID=UPI000E5C91A7|nr:acyl-CoA thioesterase [Algihabitans albus]
MKNRGDGGPPDGEPALKTVAMPGDANPNGDIFGGWVMAQMDLAGAVPAVRRAQGRVATVAVEAMRFHKPVFVGDLVSCYADLVTVGRTSMTVRVETWAERRIVQERVKVTEGIFVYVAIDETGGKRSIPEV